jgi:hypothetical protein
MRFYRPGMDQLDSIWREVRRLWRGDNIRRPHEQQLHQMRHAAMLDQCELWIAWNEAPTDHYEWGGPHYCVGIVVTCARGGRLCVQWAAGRLITIWLPLAVRAIEERAGARHIDLYCRTGWKRDLAYAWNRPITVHRDPGLLRLYPDARAATA